jgi:hypothetical protein
VTHQVNITAITGEWAGIGEVFILSAKGELLARSMELIA